MTDYYTYVPNPINPNTTQTFDLIYNAFEILRPIGIFTLYDKDNNKLAEFDPITTFATGSGLYNPISLVFDAEGDMYALCDLTASTDINILGSTTFSVVKIPAAALQNGNPQNIKGEIFISGSVNNLGYGTPSNIVIDDVGKYVYVCFGDSGNVLQYDLSGGTQTNNTNFPLLENSTQPYSMCSDNNSNIYVVNILGLTSNIYKYDKTGVLDTTFQFTIPDLSVDGGFNGTTTSVSIQSICCDKQNSYLYFCLIIHSYSNRIGSRESYTWKVYQCDLNGENIIILLLDGIPQTSTAPCIIYDNLRYLYVTTNPQIMRYSPPDHYSTIYRIDTHNEFSYIELQNLVPNQEFHTVAYSSQHQTPGQLTLHSTDINNGNQFVLTQLQFDPAFTSLSITPCYHSEAELNYPQYMVFDIAGVFYVSDAVTGRILQISKTGVITPYLSLYNRDIMLQDGMTTVQVTQLGGIAIDINTGEPPKFYVATSDGSNIYVLRCPLTDPTQIAGWATISDYNNPQGIVYYSKTVQVGGPGEDIIISNMYATGVGINSNQGTSSIFEIPGKTSSLRSVVDITSGGIFYGLAIDTTVTHLYGAVGLQYQQTGLQPGFVYQYDVSDPYNPSYDSSLYISSYTNPPSTDVLTLYNPTGIVFDNLDNLYVSAIDAEGNGIVVQNSYDSIQLQRVTTLFAKKSRIMNNNIGIALDVNGTFPTGDLYIACQNTSLVTKASTHNIIFHNISTRYLLLGLNYLNIEDPYNTIPIVVLCICYRKGTRIATRTGYKAIEDIVLGDEIVTVGDIATTYNDEFHIRFNERPKTKKVIARGSYKVAVTSEKTAPICIRRNALGQNQPQNDLYVSPEHKIISERGTWRKAKDLVNGSTIIQDRLLQNIEYWHIELEQHSVIIAENMLSESYRIYGEPKVFTRWEQVANYSQVKQRRHSHMRLC